MMKEQLKEKTKESLASVLPITVIVFLLSATVVPMETGTLLLFLIGAMLLIVGLTIATTVIRSWLCTSLGARISMDLRAKLYEKVQALSLTFLHGRKPGDLMNRITWDTSEIR
mgnify:CR=1 FL=1